MTACRPHYHFSPQTGWLNDPNGLVWHDGQYHLFYQWCPGLLPDRMGWHHAVSTDLVRWNHLPVALEPDELGQIWSGSAVVDAANTSGLFAGAGGLVSIFTHHADSNAERQSIAFSEDRGRTWTKYSRNPVLGDDACRDFRDPKVFWHERTGRWVMIVGVPHQLFASSDLKTWSPLGPTGFTSECPDLFPVRMEGQDASKWVLSLAGTHVVIGRFDGLRFTPESGPVVVDAGGDFYAAQSWDNAPAGRRIWLAWLNHWKYARQVPDFGARGFLTIPRELSLRRTPTGNLALVQKPVAELQALRTATERISPPRGVPARACGDALEIVATIAPRAGDRCGLRVRASTTQETLIGYDAVCACAFLDRGRSGHRLTQGSFRVPLPLRDRTLRAHVFIDSTCIEVFLDDGQAVFTSLIYPDPAATTVEWFSANGKSGLEELTIHQLAST